VAVDAAGDSCSGGGGGGNGMVAAVSWLLLECTPLDDSLWPLHAACGEWPAADASDSDFTVSSSSKSSAAVNDIGPATRCNPCWPATDVLLYTPPRYA